MDWALEISSAGVDFSGNDTQTEPGGSAPQAFSIDTTGTTLNAGTTYTFKLTVSSTQTAGNNIALDTLLLMQSPQPATDADQWYYLHFANATPTSLDWEADPNGDGYNNYAAYALGGSPHWFDASMLPVLEPSTPGFNYIYNSRTAQGSNSYIVESSDNLQPPWTPLAGATTETHPTLPGFDRVTMPLPEPSGSRLFFRLHIE